ncbi:hypothetical protein V8F06_013027 [Rhypophila decipiens]
MFGSRRYRSPNQPHNSTTFDPNATTAAAAVFKRQQSNTSLLSAAAAAAALQAYPTAPTRVADVQTKRTLRRSSSIASSATVTSDTQGRPGLQRRGSSGSMTERTFRTPSPHRPGSSGLGRQNSYTRAGDMPPVPALPRDVETESVRSGVDTRPGPTTTNSLGMRTTSLRLASQTLGSGEAPSWFGAAKMGDPGNVRRTDPAMASPPSSPPQVALDQSPVELGRSSSRTSSINFSYPKRARVGSPTSSPVESRFPAELPAQHAQHTQWTHNQPQAAQRNVSEPVHSPSRNRSTSSQFDQTLVYDPNSRRMVPRAQLLAVEQAIIGAPQKPVKTRRKRQTSQNSAGSHLAQGTVGRSKSLSSRPDSELESIPAKPRAFPLKSDARPEIQEYAEEPAVKAIITSPRIEAKRFEQQRANTANTSTSQSRVPETAEVIEPVLLSSPRTTVRRQPSVVREESEPEDWDSPKEVQKNVSEALDSVPSRQRVHETTQPATRTEPEDRTTYRPIVPPLAAPALQDSQTRGLADTAVIVPAKPQSPEISETSKSFRDRTQSISPPRQAHFAPIHSSLSVMHSPPPRSVSPRKSALKHTSPSRGASPSDEASDASLGLARRDDQPITRKKSVRVSFDDGNTVVVGESASTNESDSPMVASPQTRRPWYSSIGRAKKELGSLDDDEVMKPRPALPSFGSIRDKKPRDFSPVEVERPLVRPMLESAYSPVSTGSPSLAPSIASTVAEDRKSDLVPLAHSNDHAVGAVLGKAFETRVEGPARIHDPREPLPPVVTSVEGTGYLSDSSSTSSNSEFEQFELSHEAPVTENAVATTTNSSGTTEGSKDGEVAQEINIPTISISQPSPRLLESSDTKSSNPYFVDIPGGFPDDDSEPSLSEETKTTGADTSAYISASQVSNLTGVNQLSAAPQSTQLQVADQPSDSESSIYSDAYEDLSDMEGGGFLSLDAVLESSPSPVASFQNAPPHAETAPEKPKPQEQVPQPESQAQVVQTAADSPAPSPSQDDWEKAKAYWRTLTADKRAQLEREALEEAGIDADMEETPPVQKPKKKKSLERRNSERKALAVHLAQQMMAKQQNGQPSNPSRSYMIKPGTKWPEPETTTSKLRTSLRGDSGKHSKSPSSSDTPHFRKSLRQGNEGSQPASKARHAALPAPIPVPQPQPTGNGKVQKVPAASKQQLSGNSGVSPIKRRGSTDSESSFKRARAGGSTHQGFGFRKSMRQGSPTPEAPAPRQNKRFSLRSLSPMSGGGGPRQGQEHPPVSLANNQMRRTLRDSSDERKSDSKVHMHTFGLAAGGKKNMGKKGFKTKSSSRFADSSDEDDVGGGRGFRSRFEDSSDDDVVSPMPLHVPLPKASAKATSSPIPQGPPAGRRHLRNQDSVASTALAEELEESENSDDEKHRPVGDNKITLAEALAQSRTGSGLDSELRRTRSGRGSLVVPTSKSAPVVGTNGVVTTVTSGAVRPGSSSSKRSSFMSALKRKKNTSSVSGTNDKISRPVSESAARRDTKLERSVDQLRGIRGNVDVVEEGEEDETEAQPQSPPPQSPPKSPRLQKRILSFTRSPAAGAGTEDAVSPGEFVPDTEGFGAVGGLKRPATSGNLGTRTLSGGSISAAAAAPGFLQNRTASAGVMSLDAATSGSVAGTGTPQKKKKFGALRRMFGLSD